MTDEMKMEAGPELDRMVAEKVMCWKLGESEWCHGPMTHGGSFMRFWLDRDGQYAKHGATIFSEKWNPSSDISAAWQVVEKLISDGWHFNISFKGHWVASIYNESEVRAFYGHAETAPSAISRAALKAVEGK